MPKDARQKQDLESPNSKPSGVQDLTSESSAAAPIPEADLLAQVQEQREQERFEQKKAKQRKRESQRLNRLSQQALSKIKSGFQNGQAKFHQWQKSVQNAASSPDEAASGKLRKESGGVTAAGDPYARAVEEAERRVADERRKKDAAKMDSRGRAKQMRRKREQQIRRTLKRQAKSLARSPLANELQSKNEAAKARLTPGLRSRRLVMLTLALIFALAVTLIALMPQFYLEDVMITGVKTLDATDIRHALNVKPGQHLLTLIQGGPQSWLSLENQAMEERLLDRFPYLRSAHCYIRFPSQLCVDVEERVEVAYLAIPGGFAMIDREGKVLQMNAGNPPKGIPLIEGLATDHLQTGAFVNPDQRQSLDATLQVIDALLRADQDSNDGLAVFLMLQSVRIMDHQKLYLTMNDVTPGAPFSVMLTVDSDFSKQLSWLRQAIKMNDLSNLGAGYLDLSGKNRVFIALKAGQGENGGKNPLDELIPELTEASQADETKSTDVAQNDPLADQIPELTEAEETDPPRAAVPTAAGDDDLFERLPH